MMYSRWLVSLIWIGNLCAAELTPARQAELDNMLVQDCGSCHGLLFKGGLGPALLPQNLQVRPRDFLIHSILDGRPGTAMPGWKALLNEQEAGWMLDRLLGPSDKEDKS